MGEPDFQDVDAVVEETLHVLETQLQKTEQAAKVYAQTVDRLVRTYQALADAASAGLPPSDPPIAPRSPEGSDRRDR